MNTKNKYISNLYIDESGFYYIGQPYYRFFLLSAIIITPDQKNLADLLFAKWRMKYLNLSDKCFHAVDFFENRKEEYKKNVLSIKRNFNKASKELLDILSYITFDASVFYIDVLRLRARMRIPEPPKEPFINIDNKEFAKIKEEYSRKIKDTYHDKSYNPLRFTIRRAFKFHSDTMAKLSSPELSIKGYINFESQSTSDVQLIDIFHKYRDQNYVYGENVIGINLHTKGSLDGGIELSDIISYITCQNLRIKHKLNNELKNIPRSSIERIKEFRDELRLKYDLKCVNATEDSL